MELSIPALLVYLVVFWGMVSFFIFISRWDEGCFSGPLFLLFFSSAVGYFLVFQPNILGSFQLDTTTLLFLPVAGAFFWLVMLVVVTAIVWHLESEKLGWALGIFIAGVTFCVLFSDAGENAYHFLLSDWTNIIWLLGGYVTFGIAWGFCKWYFKLHRIKEQYLDDVRKWMSESYGRDLEENDVPEDLRKSWKDHLYSKYSSRWVVVFYHCTPAKASSWWLLTTISLALRGLPSGGC